MLLKSLRASLMFVHIIIFFLINTNLKATVMILGHHSCKLHYPFFLFC